MPTEVLRVDDRVIPHEELEGAGRILREGGLVAFPTETVYGIAVSAERPEAVERLYALKGRARTKPMTVMISDLSAVHERCGQVPAKARALMRRFWPGPLTIVLPDREGRMTGFRVPASPLARALVEEAGVPLLVPSANPADAPPATTAEQVLAYFPTELDLVIDGGPSVHGVASTVVQVVDDAVEVLREGAIPEARLHVGGGGTVLLVCTGNTDRSPLGAALLRRHLARHLGVAEGDLKARGYQIASAGIAAVNGRRASASARRVARSFPGEPIDLEGHRSRKLTAAMVESSSLILCMERAQREQILAFFPHRERDVLLVDPEGADIEDPVGQPLEAYRRLARRLDAAAALLVWGVVRPSA